MYPGPRRSTTAALAAVATLTAFAAACPEEAAAQAPAPVPEFFECGCWNHTGAEECPRWWHRDVRYRPLVWVRTPVFVAPRASGGGVRHIGRFYSASEMVETALRPRGFDCRYHRPDCLPSPHRGTPPIFP